MSEQAKFSVKGLDLHYGDFHALKDVNLDINAKEITAFIGPSGCGKSTFLKTLNRMNDLDDVIFARMTNLLSHGNHSIFNPVEMVEDNKEIFRNILKRFLENYKFNDDLFND